MVLAGVIHVMRACVETTTSITNGTVEFANSPNEVTVTTGIVVVNQIDEPFCLIASPLAAPTQVSHQVMSVYTNDESITAAYCAIDFDAVANFFFVISATYDSIDHNTSIISIAKALYTPFQHNFYY